MCGCRLVSAVVAELEMQKTLSTHHTYSEHGMVCGDLSGLKWEFHQHSLIAHKYALPRLAMAWIDVVVFVLLLEGVDGVQEGPTTASLSEQVCE